jgi:release factor glutamine methyltransferase
VRDWEPRAALVDEGQTTRLVDVARAVLDGSLVLEVHEERAAEIARQLEASGYRNVKVSRDLAGRDRIVDGRWMP